MSLSWKTGGLALGLVFFLAVALVKPIGVSTQFVIFDGIVWSLFDDGVVQTTAEGGHTSKNAYLAKSGGKYAKSVANPLNYSFVFVLALMLGAGVSSYLRKGVPEDERYVPELWRLNLGDDPGKRALAAFVGGFIVLYGARLAGGCTSGHMMSGVMQTAISGYVFAIAAFGAAIVTARMLFREG